MIAEYLSGEKRFYSIDACLEEKDDGIWGMVGCTPLLHDTDSSVQRRFSGMLSDEDLDSLARAFGEETFFIPPAHGCYVGKPVLPITRVLLLSLGNGKADLHIRCTPLSDMLDEIMDVNRASLVRDLMGAVLRAGQNIIICGRSGVGKTRLMVTLVFPRLAAHRVARVEYVETLPELVHVLAQNYPPPDYRYYTILSPGLSQRGSLCLGDIIQFLRSSSPELVVLQEAHTEATGYATPAELRGLVSSGVQFTITAHPSFESPIETAEYYIDTYGVKGAGTVVVQLSGRAITFVHSSARRAMVFCSVPFDRRREVFTDVSRDMPSEIADVVLLASPRTGGKNV